MKILRNKKYLYHHKSIKGIKTAAHNVIELSYKVFDYVWSFILVGWKI